MNSKNRKWIFAKAIRYCNKENIDLTMSNFKLYMVKFEVGAK